MQKIALVGNPNVGKSTIFNLLTGLNQKVGNYPGVTVDKKYGTLSINEQTIEVVDLPGCYSLNPQTEDEKVVLEYLTGTDAPDLVIGVVDASNLERNLLLFTQVYDLSMPLILVINRIDMAESFDWQQKAQKLSELLGGIAVVPINAKKGDIESVKSALISFEDSKTRQPFYEKSEGDTYTDEVAIRHKKIEGLLKFVKKTSAKTKSRITERVDAVLMHKFWGYVVFLFILLVIFQFIYVLAGFPQDMIDQFFAVSGAFVDDYLPEGPLTSLLAEGIIPGLGGVIIFIPQIAILFLFLTILEETGYMTRVVFLMDKIMRPFGLHGKSVVPLISGVACAIPAIMSSRSIDQPKERLITILVTPLMSCSARLPVYVLLIALTVPDVLVLGFMQLQGLVLLGMYLLGVVASLVFGFLFKLVLTTKSTSFLIMEMPDYQKPVLKNVLLNVVEKSKSFVWGAGRIIMAISIILWVLGSYGPASFQGGKQSEDMLPQTALEHSFVGILGKTIEPAIAPLGYDWKIGISLITSFAAREVFVGTMATIYSIEDVESESSLMERMNQEVNPITGEKRYGLATGISLMVFYAFAMQCMSTLAITKRETKSWKWPLVQFGYMTILAYVSSLITYQLLS